MESFSHSDISCSTYLRARAGMAPSEWLMRCVFFSSVGNSARVASKRASSELMAPGA